MRKIESKAKEARRVVNILPLIITLLCRLRLFCTISKGKNAAFSLVRIWTVFLKEAENF